MGSLFGGDAPSMPAPLPPPPAYQTPNSNSAASSQGAAAAAAAGADGTIITGPEGLKEKQSTSNKQLTGS